MRRLRCAIALSILIATTVGATSLLAGPARVIDVGPEGAIIPSDGPIAAIERHPLHGTLQVEALSLHYQPSTDFWTLGHDRLTYIDNVGPVSIHLLANRPRSWRSFAEIEAPTSESWRLDGEARFVEQAPGSTVLRVIGQGSAGYRFPEETGNFQGGGATAGGAGSVILPPRPPWTDGDPFADAGVRFLDTTGYGGRPFALHLRSAGDNFALGIEVFGTMAQWITLPGRPFALELDWWLEPGDTSGLAVWVDEVAVYRDSGLDLITIEQVRLGIMDPGFQPLLPLTFDFDNVEMHGGAFVPEAVLLSAEDFDGTVSKEWMTGGRSLPAAVPTSFSSAESLALYPAYEHFAMNPSPYAAQRYNLRFLLVPDDLSMFHGDVVGVFDATESDDMASQASHIRLRLRNNNGNYVLKVFVGLDAESGWINFSLPVQKTPQTLEIEWRAATQAERPNGWFRLWIDGVPRVEALELDNDQRRIEAIRLGATTVYGQVSGVYYFDDFAAWRRLP